MEIKGIVSVTGLPGLYKAVNQRSDGYILSELGSNTMKFVPSRLHQISPLESIAIYTLDDTVELSKVFENMEEKNISIPENINKISEKELRKIMAEILPDYDPDRVYASDIKKLLKWYDLLKKVSPIN
jgi:hypothetical protein